MNKTVNHGLVCVPVCASVCDRVGSYQTNMVNEMLATIVSIQPKDSGGSGGETRESVVYRLADDMLSKLPADYVQHEVQHTLTAVTMSTQPSFPRGTSISFWTE